MRVRGWGWVLPVTAVLGLSGLLGCSSAESTAGADYQGGCEGGYCGGQTGSLRPCSTPAFTSGDPSVPTGDAALVFHTGCMVQGDFSITDENGDPVPYELVALDDGVVLVKTDTALGPGEYQVHTGDGRDASVTVTEAEALPMQTGTLEREGSDTQCSQLFRVSFDTSILPYLPLVRLEYAVDNGPRQPWFEFGTVPPGSTSALLGVTPLAIGDHELKVFATIAGETDQPDPAQLSFSYARCPNPAQDPGFNCSVSPLVPQPIAPGAPMALTLLGLTVLGLRRRRGC